METEFKTNYKGVAVTTKLTSDGHTEREFRAEDTGEAIGTYSSNTGTLSLSGSARAYAYLTRVYEYVENICGNVIKNIV